MLLLGVLLLLVVGPQQLPATLRQIAHYVRQARQMVAKLRLDVETMTELPPSPLTRSSLSAQDDPAAPKLFSDPSDPSAQADNETDKNHLKNNNEKQ